ncbi:MAG: hypothetical protein GX601_03030, partial [Anaerolineales bacterium]|nr:hypothetical protein [Anaerolineales bacterium]
MIIPIPGAVSKGRGLVWEAVRGWRLDSPQDVVAAGFVAGQLGVYRLPLEQ